MDSNDKLIFSTSFSNISRPPRVHRARKPPIADSRPRGLRRSLTPPPLSPEYQGSPLFEPISDTESAQGLKSTLQSAPMSGGGTSDPNTALPHSTDNLNNPSEMPEVEQPQPSYTYRDLTGVLREVWQPGHGDGVPNGELPGAISFKERWRFFQSDIGPMVRRSNSPPKFVVLDDKSCHDIWKSNLYNISDRSRYWCHDFSIHGAIRHGRPNRGRAVLMSAEDGGEMIDRNDSCGPREVGWAITGSKKKGKRYHFTGERHGYEEVKFGIPVDHLAPLSASQEQPQPDGESGTGQQEEAELAQSTKAKGERKASSVEVRQQNSLPSTPSPKHKRTRGHAYLRKSITPSPPWSESKSGNQDFNERTLAPFPTIARSVSATGTRSAPNAAFIDGDSSSSPSPPRPADAKKSGARTVYAGMTYHYQDDHNFPAILGGNSYAARGAGNRTPRIRTPVPADTHDEEGNAEYEEEYHGRHTQQAGESGYRFNPQLPVWMSVKTMEDALHDAKRKLISRDDEIAGLRREVARLRDMCVERLRERDEPDREIVDPTNEKNRGDGAESDDDEKEIKVEDDEDEESAAQEREMVVDRTTRQPTTGLASSKTTFVVDQDSTWRMTEYWMGPLRLGGNFNGRSP